MEQQTEEVVRIFISYSHDSEEHRGTFWQSQSASGATALNA